MMQDAFSAPGRFFRGNLHTHTNRSDGVLSAEEVCRRYREEGYDFLVLSDHFAGPYGYPITDARPFNRPGFVTIPGAELHSGAMQNGEIWHILAVGLPRDFAPSNTPDWNPIPDQETGPALAARARAAGCYVAVAHPEWSGMTLEDARSIEAAHAIEVYNHGCAVGADRGRGFHVLDLLLTEGRDLTLCATDDAHFHEADHFGGWVMVKAEENDPEAIVEALKMGHSYSSQGPDLHGVAIEGRSVEVACSAATSVIVQGPRSAAIAVHGQSMTRASVPLAHLGGPAWVRVTVVDRAGRRAWSNPIRPG